MTYDEIVDWFESRDEWEEFPINGRFDRHDRQWFKKNPGAAVCLLNDRPPAIKASLWDYREYNPNAMGVELDLVGNYRDERWATLKVHTLYDMSEVPDACEELLGAWHAMVGIR